MNNWWAGETGLSQNIKDFQSYAHIANAADRIYGQAHTARLPFDQFLRATQYGQAQHFAARLQLIVDHPHQPVNAHGTYQVDHRFAVPTAAEDQQGGRVEGRRAGKDGARAGLPRWD